MWETDSLWFETAIVSITFALGHIFFGHFEERTRWPKKLLKYMLALLLVIALSLVLGRVVALTIYALLFVPVVYVHFVLLPRKGINGWTGEPRARYYEFRKWDKDIFKEK